MHITFHKSNIILSINATYFVLRYMNEWHLRDGEVDNRGVLFHKEVVLGESFDAKHEVRRKFGQLEPFEKILFVGFVLLNVNEMGEHALIFRGVLNILKT